MNRKNVIKYFIFLIVFLDQLNTVSQNKVDSTFSGLNIEYYRNGSIKNKIEFSNGKPSGLAQMYDSLGNMSESGYWYNNRWSGNYSLYYPNGQVMHSFNFEDGKRLGLVKYYHENGIVAIIGTYVNGKEQGAFIEFDKNGKQKGETQYYYNGKKTILYLFNSIVKGTRVNLSADDEAKKEIEKSLIDFVNIENSNVYRKINLAKTEEQLLLKNKEALISEMENTRKKQEIEILQKTKELSNYELQKTKKEKELERRNFEKQEIVRKAELEKEKFQKAILSGFIGFVILIAGFIFFSLQKNKKQSKIIIAQKHLVDEKQKEIIESITYAKRLQEAILPPQKFIDQYIKDNFILYKPKDLVAGDFYWAEVINDLFFIAAADSTGHGVPGAMVSVVCSNALNRSIKEFKETEPGKILDKTRELVIETFEKSANEVKDGMDISLLCIDTKNKNIFWSGAHNPLWYISHLPSTLRVPQGSGLVAEALEATLTEIKADKQPIGKTVYPKPFITHQIDYEPNTTFYLFTDGFADQFGGPKGKKFMSKNFKEVLVANAHLPLSKQKEVLEHTFKNWVGDLEQVDDVCVIGIRI